MAYSYTRRIELWLLVADALLAFAWCVVAWHFPPAHLMSVLGYVTAVSWLAGMITVGGQNPAYLHPRYRIFVSMGLSLTFALVVGLFWAGSGWTWYMKGGLLSWAAIGAAGTLLHFILAFFLHRPAVQLVPCRLPEIYQPLLAELAQHPHVRVEAELNDPTDPLPDRRPGYPIYLVVSDLHLREVDFAALMPLYPKAEIIDLCELYESLLGKVAVIQTSDGWVLPQALRVPSPIREVLKRVLEVLVMLVTAPLTLPLIGSGALLVKCTSAGPIFFVQERLGRYGKPFRLYKLRTMVADAEAHGPQWAGARDARVTPIGRFLRSTGIDELPQLWNILRGEMSLVGPRPELPAIVERLERQIPFYRARLLVAPGLTGWAQLHQGGDATLADVANKLRYDLYYLKYGTPILDLRILLHTAQMIFHLAKPRPKMPSTPRIPTATGV